MNSQPHLPSCFLSQAHGEAEDVGSLTAVGSCRLSLGHWFGLSPHTMFLWWLARVSGRRPWGMNDKQDEMNPWQ